MPPFAVYGQVLSFQPLPVSANADCVRDNPNTSAVPAAFLIKVRRERLAVGVDVMGCGLLGSVFIGGFFVLVVYSNCLARAAPRKGPDSPTRLCFRALLPEILGLGFAWAGGFGSADGDVEAVFA